MATNKNAQARYQALDKCFRNPGKKYYIDDLVEACTDSLLDLEPDSFGIQKRQIYDDINFMEDIKGYDAPIERHKDGRKVYYRYSDIDFSINSQPLNEQEAQQLKETLLTLSRFKGMPQFEWVEEMVTRLESSFSLTHSDNRVIEFEQNPYLHGLDFISAIYQAIVNKQVLEVTYQGFLQEESKTFVFHPYYLKQYNNRWFLLGLNPNFDNMTNLALDRIKAIKELNVEFVDSDIDFEEYFEDVIGVTIPMEEELQTIRLEVENTLFPYIDSKPLHGSQKIKEKKMSSTIVELELIPNYEFESLMLSYGEKIRIISPESLKLKLLDGIERLYQEYK